MDSAVKRREPEAEQEEHQRQQAADQQKDKGEDASNSSGDRLVSPCKRLRLEDSPDEAADHANLQGGQTPDTVLVDGVSEVLENPGPSTSPAGQMSVEVNGRGDDCDRPAESEPEQSPVTDSADSAEHLLESNEEVQPNNDVSGTAEVPHDDVLTTTPVKAIMFEDEGEDEEENDVHVLATPQYPIPHNTPERSIIVDGNDDSDGEDIIINQVVLDDEVDGDEDSDGEDLVDGFVPGDDPLDSAPPSGVSVTFADRTNVHGVCRDGEPHTPAAWPEQSITFADHTNVHGVHKAVDSHVNSNMATTAQDRKIRQEDSKTTYPGPQLQHSKEDEASRQPDPVLPRKGVNHRHPDRQQQRHRFNSDGNLLCPEEMDHHRLSLQSYGSLAYLEQLQQQQQQRLRMASVDSYLVSRNTAIDPRLLQEAGLNKLHSQRTAFQPQNLDHRFSQAQPYPQPAQERLVDYGCIDGPRGEAGGHGGGGVERRTQNVMMSYGLIDAPVPRMAQPRDPDPRAPHVQQSRSQGRLWYYGSVDNPQRLASSTQSLHHDGQGERCLRGFPPQLGADGISQSHSNLRTDQAFVRSASRRTLSQLSSQGSRGRLEHHPSAGSMYTGAGPDGTEAPRHYGVHPLEQVPEVAETSTAEIQTAASSKTSRGSMCMLTSQGTSANSQEAQLPLHSNPHHHYHPPASASSGSQGEQQSQTSSGKSGWWRTSDRDTDPHQHFSGSQGSLSSQARSMGSQRSADSQGLSLGSQNSGSSRDRHSQGKESRTTSRHSYETVQFEEPWCPAGDPVLLKASKKRKVLETPGQVRVSAYLNCGLVTVHVIEGRNFACTWKPVCDSYIKLSLIPEEGKKKLRLKSKPVLASNSPVFDEKFSLELQKSDEDKRLLVSVWHKDMQSGCSEFLGCMSFGVKGILRHKEVNGWYYLLTEDVGKKKHLQVSTRTKAALKPRGQSIPQINRDVFGLEAVTIHVERGKNGFGFTVVDEFPVKVGRVDLASPAEDAGLKPGDFIIKVNSQNVSRSTVSSVAKLVKKSGQSLVLLINRQQCAPEETKPAPPTSDPTARSEASLWRRPEHIYESIAGDSVWDKTEQAGANDNKENENTMDSRFELSSVYEPFSKDKVSASTPLVPRDFKPEGSASRNCGSGDQKKLEAIHRLMSLELDFIDFMQLGVQRYCRPLRHRIFTVGQHNAVFQNIDKLVNISEYHVQQMQENAPSMYPESDDDSQSSEDRHFTAAVAMIYYSKVHMFCQAHEAYAAGLSEANRVLSDMRQNEEFLHFIKDPPLEPGQPSISAFIFRPLQHIKELSSVFQEIFISTPSSSIDHATLKQVTHVLQESVHTISNLSNARVQSLTSLSSHTRSSSSSKGSYCASSVASSRDSGSESGHRRRRTDNLKTSASQQAMRTMDRDVLKLQDRLVFSENVPVFQLCQEDRHLIYQGDLFFLHNKHWSKVQMVLLSDVMLLCRPDRDGCLHVQCDPIMLQDICHIDTNRKHSTEMMLNTCPTSPCTGIPATQNFTFRTPTPEDLSTWRSLLEQHVRRSQVNSTEDSQCSISDSATQSVLD